MQTDYRPRIKLPRPVHTALKTWASSHETTLQEAVIIAVKTLVGIVPKAGGDTCYLNVPSTETTTAGEG